MSTTRLLMNDSVVEAVDRLRPIDEALGDLAVTEPTLAPLARAGVTHR